MRVDDRVAVCFRSIGMKDKLGTSSSDSRLIGLRDWNPSRLFAEATKPVDSTDRTIAEVIDVVRTAASQWDLTVLTPFPEITHNFVTPVLSGAHGQAVLKVAFGKYMYNRECRALRSFAGDGAVQVYEWDDDLFAMLLERADPGQPMMLDWDGQTEAFCGLLNVLWKTASNDLSLPSVASEAQARSDDLSIMERILEGDKHRQSIVRAARLILKDLVDTSDEDFLIHGDLHTGNILSARRMPWLCIDPIGCIGERAFDACSILRDDNEELQRSSHPHELVNRRITDIASTCSLDGQRLRAWSFVEAVRMQGWRYKTGFPLDEWSTLIPVLQP